ncbi:cyclin-T1-like isoform X2 [Montipora capricornis]|uniref:cyclin-T1-like isoform X2 n=2 Tax=Montipora capricornis TaxID=246305 RepID=UPI0035F13AFA
MGQRLSVNQLTINTAIVYMHRFYMFHSFNKFHRNHRLFLRYHTNLTTFVGENMTDHYLRNYVPALAPCCLFLAAKTEEQPRKLEHVLKVAHACLHRDGPPLDPKSEEYLQQAQDLIENESILLQTLGFEITVHHPHTYVVKCIQLVRASKDLRQTSYFMATNSLHLTTLCLQYKPPVVACACIHLASKWSNWEIPRSNDGKDWWEYIDPTVNKSMLDDIAQDFLKVMEKCPNRLKRKINTVTNLKGSSHSKVPKGESNSSSSRTSSSSTAATSSASHSLVDGAQNGFSAYDGFQNDSDGKALHKTKSDRDRERERDKERESSLGTLKPLPVTSTVTASATAGESSSTPNTTLLPLPPLPPLTSKYATATSVNPGQSNELKGSSYLAHSTPSSSESLSSRGKHRYHHDESQPSKKHKSSHPHSQRSHSSSSSSSHRKLSGSSHSSDSSPSSSNKHGHSSAHKGSSHSSKPLNPLHHHAQTGLTSQSAHLPSHSHSHTSKKLHPSSHPSSHKSSSSSTHHGHHGHSSTHRPPSASSESSKKHSSTAKPGATASSQPVPTARPLPTPPPPPPPPSTLDLSVLSSLNTPGMLGAFPGAEMQAMQFPSQFMPPVFASGMMSGMMQGVVPPPPPPDPEPTSPPPPPPPPMP